ncbi:MAG: hypothetical protein KF752_12990 [Pirellulaceae bacterium]|nr:hypothetical protein [Pirellulaceae bacterium]
MLVTIKTSKYVLARRPFDGPRCREWLHVFLPESLGGPISGWRFQGIESNMFVIIVYWALVA